MTARTIIIAPPTADIVSSRCGDVANHCLAFPAMIAKVPSLSTATTAKITPRTSICSQTLPRPGSTNWGSSAAKKTIVFGLVSPTR